MKQAKSGSFVLAALLVCTLFVAGCTKKDSNPIPPAGTAVNTSSEVYRQAAKGLQPDCVRTRNCVCTLDGIQTSCALVFACLDSGNCTRKP